jgi:hypothetical protein
MATNSKFVVQGDAKDQETVIKLRPWIEDEARKEYGSFDRTELYWNMNQETGLFNYEIHFFDGPKSKNANPHKP